MIDMPSWDTQEFDNFCQDETLLVPFDRYSPDQLDYDSAQEFCKTLGGQMAMPASLADERGKWTQQFASYHPRYHIERRFFFLPVTDKGSHDFWINDMNGKEPSYTNWDIKETNGGTAENCTVLILFNPEQL
jgi:hypothetical protein